MAELPFPRDPVIEAYKKDVDSTLLIENLRRSPSERFERFVGFMEFIYEMRASRMPQGLATGPAPRCFEERDAPRETRIA